MKNYTIEKKNDTTILLTYNSNYNHGIGYSRNPYNILIEIQADFNNQTLKINRFRKKQEFSYRLLKDKKDPLANWQSKEQAINYTSKTAINNAIKEIKKNIKNLLTELETARENPLYQKLKIIADQKIKHYKTDFNYHDCLMIHRKKPVKFIWMVRNTGTWNLTENNKFTQDLLKSRDFSHEYYYINGMEIKRINQDQAQEILNKMN